MKVVLGGGGHVDDVRPALGIRIVVAGAAGHGVGVHVDRIDRIAHGHDVVHGEDIADVAAVALGAVGDEDLVRGDGDVPRGEIVLGDGVAQKGVALLGAVAVEGLGSGEVVYGGVHGGDDGRGERAGDVADAHLDEARFGVRLLVGGGAAGDFREQVAAGQLLVVAIDAGHGASFMVRFSDALRLGGECFQWEKTRRNLINGQISAVIVDNLWASRLRRALGVFERRARRSLV